MPTTAVAVTWMEETRVIRSIFNMTKHYIVVPKPIILTYKIYLTEKKLSKNVSLLNYIFYVIICLHPMVSTPIIIDINREFRVGGLPPPKYQHHC